MTTTRPEITGRKVTRSFSSGIATAAPGIGHNQGPLLPELSALDLERHVSVPEAAAFKGISYDTFKRHYSHLIRKVSPRRETVKLRDLFQE